MTQPNRPTPRFQVVQQQPVWTPADWQGRVISREWRDGEWCYLVRANGAVGPPCWYAEHELTEAGR